MTVVRGRHHGVGTAELATSPSSVAAEAGLGLTDIDIIELNEAFAARVQGRPREWKLSERNMAEHFNVDGADIPLGHPIGATGSRIPATFLDEMDRRGSRSGVETLCICGGRGIAAEFKRTENRT